MTIINIQTNYEIVNNHRRLQMCKKPSYIERKFSSKLPMNLKGETNTKRFERRLKTY